MSDATLPAEAATGPAVDRLSTPKISLARLGWTFLWIGAAAFGGMGSTFAMIERELIDKVRVLTRADLTEALTYTRMLPGSTSPQVVAYLGFRVAGWIGAAISAAMFVLPAAAMMLVAAALYASVEALPGLAMALRGVAAAVLGLLVTTSYRLARGALTGPADVAAAAAAFAAAVLFSIPAALIVAVAGGAGMVSAAVRGADRGGAR